MGDSAHDLALDRTKWAKSRKGFAAWCSDSFGPRTQLCPRAIVLELDGPPRPGTFSRVFDFTLELSSMMLSRIGGCQAGHQSGVIKRGLVKIGP